MRVIMITGDSRETAIAVSTELGIYERDSISLTTADIDSCTDTQMDQMLDKVAVFYRMSPSHKMKIIKAFKRRGAVVAMTG